MYTNCDDKNKHFSGTILTPISDHFPYFYGFEVNSSIKTNKYTITRNLDQKAINNIYNDLSKVNIINNLNTNSFADPNKNYNIFEHIITSSINKHSSVKTKFDKYRHKNNPWITFGILKSIKFRDRLYKSYKLSSPNTVEFFNSKLNLSTYNRILNRTICYAKILYYHKEFNKYKTDSKQTWKIINSLIKRKEIHRLPEYMNLNNHRITDKPTIVNQFNNYFATIGSQMASSIENIPDKSFKQFLTKNIDTQFSFKEIDANHVKHVIHELIPKQSSGHDEITSALIKQLEPIISKPLSIIINQSFNTGIFPDKLKLAKIVPIFKKNDKHTFENYRPISILPSISKIFEKIVFHQLFTYFSKNNYLDSNQYGFRNLHSTEHAVLEIVDRALIQIDKGNSAIAIFLDLSKAFDTLDHNILISKLNYYGIKNVPLKWFENYLDNRKHYTEVDQTKSETSNISLGVPQGTILGPLFFLIYINDIQSASSLFRFIKYADDTALFCTFVYNNCKISDINSNLQDVYQWLCINKLSINITKTKFMIFQSRQKYLQNSDIQIKIKNKPVGQVCSFNFLGIILDQHLNWNEHINHTSITISRYVGIFCKLKHYLPLYILRTLYNSLVLPQLTYRILAWGTNQLHLFKLQKKAIRIVTNSKFNEHTEPLFKALNLLKLEDLYKLSILKFYFKYCHNLLPFHFQNFNLLQRSEIHSLNLLCKTMLNTPKTRTKLAEGSLRCTLPKLINKTAPQILSKIKPTASKDLKLISKIIILTFMT